MEKQANWGLLLPGSSSVKAPPLLQNSNQLVIGEHVRIGAGLTVMGAGQVIVEDGVEIGEDVILVTSMSQESRIILEKNTKLGSRTVIYPNVIVRRGTVVGAGVVVKGNVPTS